MYIHVAHMQVMNVKKNSFTAPLVTRVKLSVQKGVCQQQNLNKYHIDTAHSKL